MKPPVSILGVGVVGGRAARELVSGGSIAVALGSGRSDRRAELERAFGRSAKVTDHPGAVGAHTRVVVLTGDNASQAERAAVHLDAGRHVISTADSCSDVERVLALHDRATGAGRCLIAGAGFSPGLTDVLARYAADGFDTVDELRFARHGAAGPRCADQTDAALSGMAQVLSGGVLSAERAGSGRELCWFPDPIGGRDAYIAATAEPLLSSWSGRGLARASARLTATPLQRVRSTLGLPLVARGRADEGGPGAVRVEARGRATGGRRSVVLGSLDRPGVAAAALIAELVEVLLESAAPSGVHTAGTVATPATLLRHLRTRGVRVAELAPGA